MTPFTPIPPHILVGKTFGMLRVLAQAKERAQNGAVLYDCVCTCGTTLRRAGSVILFLADAGRNQSCITCRQRLRVTHEKFRHNNIRTLWDAQHTLYGARHDEREVEALRAEFAEADIGYLYPESHCPEEYDVTVGLDPWDVHPSPKQQIDDLYPLDGGEDREWVCVHCGVHTSRVFGCTRCLEPVCVQCVRDERHVCHDPGEGVTLEEIGQLEGVTRERIRQVEEIALGKLRKAFRHALQVKGTAPKGHALPIRLTEAWGRAHHWIAADEVTPDFQAPTAAQ